MGITPPVHNSGGIRGGAEGHKFIVRESCEKAFDITKFGKEHSVFIVGGAGGVGSLAIHLAKNVYGASKQSYDQVIEKFNFVFDTIGKSLTHLFCFAWLPMKNRLKTVFH